MNLDTKVSREDKKKYFFLILFVKNVTNVLYCFFF
jgi:hypothetical protein